jgi:hypothetical protein
LTPEQINSAVAAGMTARTAPAVPGAATSPPVITPGQLPGGIVPITIPKSNR